MSSGMAATTATGAGGDPGVPLFASIEGRAARLGQDEAVFFDPQRKQSHVMTLQVLQAMDLCREFQPLDAHVRRVADSLPGLKGKEQAVRRVLEGLAARGLLVSDDAWLRRFDNAAALELAPLSGLYIRACDRPARLKVLLQGLIDHDRRFGLPAQVVVVDDSTEPEHARTHRADLAAFAGQVSVPARYIGRDAWVALADRLEQGVGPGVAALLRRAEGFAGRRGGGTGKNLISLLAAGQRYVLFDDDFTLPLRQHPEHQPGIACAPQGWGIRTFATFEAALKAGVDPDRDLISEHLALCGQSVASLLREHPGTRLDRPALLGVSPSRHALLDPARRVATTVNGHRGQSGASGIAWIMLLDRAGRDALCANDEAWDALRGDPPIWWGCNRFQISEGGAFTPFCVDNSRMMPPTSPFGRGEDALFNGLCAVAHGDIVHLDAPYSVGHRQEGGRDRSALLGQAETPDINHCLGELARHVAGDLYGNDPRRRLRVFSARLEDLSGGSDESILTYLGEYLAYRRSLLIEQLQKVASSDATLPPAWRRDMASLVEANAKSLVDRGSPRLAGWASDSSAGDCVRAFRQEAAVLSQGLQSWPEAWQLAELECAGWLAEVDG